MKPADQRLVPTYRRLVAIARKELLILLRRRAMFFVRVSYAVLAGIVPTMWLADHQSPGSVGAGSWMSAGELHDFLPVVFMLIAYLQGVGGFVVGAVVGMASTREEVRSQTLRLTVMSGLGVLEIAFGKVFGVTAQAFAVVVSPLPILGFLGWLGGLDYKWLVLSFASAASLIALGSAAGVFFASRFRSLLAGLSLLFLFFVYSFVAPAWGFIVSGAGGHGTSSSLLESIGELALTVCPSSSLIGAAFQGTAEIPFFRPCAVTLAWIGLLLLGASRSLRTAAAASAPLGLRSSFERLDRILHAINLGGITFGRKRTLELKGNPVAWLGRVSGGVGSKRYAFRIAVLTTVAGTGLLLLIALIANNDSSGFPPGWHEGISGIAIAASVLLAISVGSSAVSGERARKTLNAVLATPLTARRILSGKAATFARVGTAVVGVPMFVFLCIAALLGSGDVATIIFSALFVLPVTMLAWTTAVCVSAISSRPLQVGVAAFICFFAASVALLDLPASLALVVFEPGAAGGLIAAFSCLFCVALELRMLRSATPIVRIAIAWLAVCFLLRAINVHVFEAPIDPRSAAWHAGSVALFLGMIAMLAWALSPAHSVSAAFRLTAAGSFLIAISGFSIGLIGAIGAGADHLAGVAREISDAAPIVALPELFLAIGLWRFIVDWFDRLVGRSEDSCERARGSSSRVAA